jgi:DNA (cytosine-5)-methyltransferase 1
MHNALGALRLLHSVRERARRSPGGTSRPAVLDLFCGAGGAGMGYWLAGFDVVGVDIQPQKRYPFRFIQADALTFPLPGFDLIHASPICKSYSATAVLNDATHPRQVEAVRERLAGSGVPYVIENVPGAPLRSPVMLCGAMFPGLAVYRHRLFETSFRIPAPPEPEHRWPLAKMGRPVRPGEFMQPVGHFSDVAAARAAMQIPWMGRDELAQAIPPAYTLHVGRAALAALGSPELPKPAFEYGGQSAQPARVGCR